MARPYPIPSPVNTQSECKAGTVNFDPTCSMMAGIQDKVLMDADAKQMLFLGKNRLACVNWSGDCCLVMGDAGTNVTTMRLDSTGNIVALVITDTTSIRRYVGFGDQVDEKVNNTNTYVPDFLQVATADTVVLLRVDNIYDVIRQGQVIRSIIASPNMSPVRSTVNTVIQYVINNSIRCVSLTSEAEININIHTYADHGQVIGASAEHGMYVYQPSNPEAQLIHVGIDESVRVLVNNLTNIKALMMYDKYLLIQVGNTIRVFE